MDLARLQTQIEFAVEIDKLKRIVRQTLLTDGSRQEYSAEHSWHLAVMVLVLSEYANNKRLNILRILKMVLIHDLVEIDAGDTYRYDEKANEGRPERERKAADRIFGLLPEDQSREFHSIWEEFEARETAEARFAAALDRLQPLINNYRTQGKMWERHGVKSKLVFERNHVMAEGSQVLWDYAAEMIHDAIGKGWFSE